MSRVLISGGAGFIGSHLAYGFLQEGATVRILDNLSSGKLENLESIRGRVEFIHGDVQDAAALTQICKGADYVFHEAAIPSVPLSVSDPLGTDGPNLRGTLNLLEASRQSNVRRFVFAASSAAYGNNPALPKREDMLPEPVSPYAVQKVASEMYLRSYAQVFGLETVALRYFNIFGDRQDPTSQYSGVLARFLSLMACGETPTIFGDGETSRDFTHVDNVVLANKLAAKASAAVAGKVYNVATGVRITLNQAYRAIANEMGFDQPAKYLPEREGDIRHSVADVSLSRKDLGYAAVVSFEDGLKRMIQKR